MPFTFSHPAAVLPLRRHGVFSALIIGSMAPDFLSFVPGHAYSRYGHTFRGLFLFCIPASWIALLFFHVVMKQPLAELLPESVAAKLRAVIQPFDFGVWPLKISRVAAITGSALLGAATHILWDSATHINGFIADAIPGMMAPLFTTVHGTILRIQLAQEASTWLGAFVLAWVFRQWLRRAPAAKEGGGLRLSAMAKFLLAAFMIVVTLAYSLPKALGPLNDQLGSYLNLEFFLRVTVILGMRMLLFLLVCYCVVWQALAARRPATPPAG